MINSVYNLPEIDFVGGESQDFAFNLYTLDKTFFDAQGCLVSFSLIYFSNKNGDPILVKEATIRENTNGVFNIASVELSPQDTVDLYGRYVYQLSLEDADGNVEIPGQGIVNISRNIHPQFIY